MYTIKLNFMQRTVIIPPDLVEALGSPEQISFLYNPEKKILAITSCAVMELDNGSRKGHTHRNGIELVKRWHEETGDYRIECIDALFDRLRKEMPSDEGGMAFELTGDFIAEGTVGFNLSDALPMETDPPEEPDKRRVMQRIRPPKHWPGLVLHSSLSEEEITDNFQSTDVSEDIMAGLEEALAFEQGTADAETHVRQQNTAEHQT